MRAVWALVAALSAPPALAEGAPQPPVWAYLAECSAVFAAAVHSQGYSGASAEEIALVQTASEQFLTRAIAVAGEMGQPNPKADIDSVMLYLIPRWENRIDRLFSVKSNLDWIAYCRRLGLDQGVIGIPDIRSP